MMPILQKPNLIQLLVRGLVGNSLAGKKVQLNIYAGGDNLLDEIYSLGNDINAAGGRYYNAAFARNYYFGLGFRL